MGSVLTKGKEFSRLRADVIVVGGGGSGQRAALAARESGCETVLVSKGILGRSGNTPMGRFSFCVALGRGDDTCEAHYDDIIASGEGLANERLVETFVTEAPQRLEELLSWRMRFEHEGGQLKQVRVPGHSVARALHFRQETGLEITRTMRRQIFKSGVALVEDTAALHIAVADGVVAGLLCINVWSGELLFIEAPAVILATGGAGAVFEVNSNAKDATGDGYALALQAGAALIDMEMAQFLPVGLVKPDSLKGCTDPGGALMTAGAWLLNSGGERFMQTYDPQRMEHSTRAIISRAIAAEIEAGRGTALGGVYLSLPREKGTASSIIETTWCRYMKQAGVDPDYDHIEVAQSAHYMMGGVRIDSETGSSVSGLFACGEVAGGLHGANRLAGHGLVEGQVFGAIAGRSAAKCARTSAPRHVANTAVVELWEQFRSTFCSGRQSMQPWEIKRRLASLMSQECGYVRSSERLERAQRDISDLECNLTDAAEPALGLALLEAIEARSLLTTARSITASASMRKESRGAHLRSDYRGRDESNPTCRVAVTLQRGAFFDNAILGEGA